MKTSLSGFLTGLTSEQKRRLALTVVVTVVVVVGLYFGLIGIQRDRLAELGAEVANNQLETEKSTRFASQADKYQTDLNVKIAEFDKLAKEKMVGRGDPRQDFYKLREKYLHPPYKVDIVDIKPDAAHGSRGVGGVSAFPKFPFDDFICTIIGSAKYHDLGRFIADFENQYPYSRILNLEIPPEGGGIPMALSEPDQLPFKMGISMLIAKPATLKTNSVP